MIDIADVIDLISDRELHGGELKVYSVDTCKFRIDIKLKNYACRHEFNTIMLESHFDDWRPFVSAIFDKMMSGLMECVS